MCSMLPHAAAETPARYACLACSGGQCNAARHLWRVGDVARMPAAASKGMPLLTFQLLLCCLKATDLSHRRSPLKTGRGSGSQQVPEATPSPITNTPRHATH